MNDVKIQLYYNLSKGIKGLIEEEYLEKWRQSAFSCEPINEETVSRLIETTYTLLDLPKPKIIFFTSPVKVLEQFDLNFWGSETIDIEAQIVKNLRKQVDNNLWWKLQEKLYDTLHCELWELTGAYIYETLESQSDLIHGLNEAEQSYFNPARDCIPTEYLVSNACVFDYCYSVLNCFGEEGLWQAYQKLIQNSGWLWTYKQVCFVCERPLVLSVDEERRLHGEGKPALQLSDGFSIYAHHGVILPEKYGKVHPNNWSSRWLLEENNAELRRLLMQCIGYSRISTELKAKQIDTWQEYELLSIDQNVDIEEIRLLTMTCPSTGHLHALRVPPDIETARAAIRWVNWDIDPSEFTIQT